MSSELSRSSDIRPATCRWHCGCRGVRHTRLLLERLFMPSHCRSTILVEFMKAWLIPRRFQECLPPIQGKRSRQAISNRLGNLAKKSCRGSSSKDMELTVFWRTFCSGGCSRSWSLLWVRCMLSVYVGSLSIKNLRAWALAIRLQ